MPFYPGKYGGLIYPENIEARTILPNRPKRRNARLPRRGCERASSRGTASGLSQGG